MIVKGAISIEMKFKIFNDAKGLIEFANKFIVDERLSSLKKDVKDCLDKDCAFPALLYCFSTVDLLGAVYTGFAENGPGTTNNFKAYALRFMNNTNIRYSNEQVTLIQEIFRHKIVHLAQPKLVVYSKKRDIHWRYEYPEINNHLKIEQHRQEEGRITPYRPNKDKRFHRWKYYMVHEEIPGYWGKTKIKRHRRCYVKNEAQRSQILKKLGRYRSE